MRATWWNKWDFIQFLLLLHFGIVSVSLFFLIIDKSTLNGDKARIVAFSSDSERFDSKPFKQEDESHFLKNRNEMARAIDIDWRCKIPLFPFCNCPTSLNFSSSFNRFKATGFESNSFYCIHSSLSLSILSFSSIIQESKKCIFSTQIESPGRAASWCVASHTKTDLNCIFYNSPSTILWVLSVSRKKI